MLTPGLALTLEAEDHEDEAVRRQTALAPCVKRPRPSQRTGAIAVYGERVADARRLARTHGAARGAVMTGRGESTIRSHVKHMFAKLGLSLAGTPGSRR